MESSFIRIPLEEAKREAKNLNKQIERDFNLLQSFFSSPKDPALLRKGIESGKKRLSALLAQISTSEEQISCFLEELNQRINFLNRISREKTPETQELQILRLIGDHLHRSGDCSSAQLLISLHPEIGPLLDSRLFARIRFIQSCILEKHSLGEALAWTGENKAFLKKIGSKLEFELRKQEYIEIARQRKYTECLAYAKNTLSTFIESGNGMEELMPVAGLLAIAPDTLLQSYRELYSDSRWEMLANAFKNDFYAFYGLPLESPLVLSLQAGLSALKTPSCCDSSVESSPKNASFFTAQRGENCPVCSGHFAGIWPQLPISHRANSRIVCQITGIPIDENNPPIIFPNGHVYSQRGVSKLTGANGKFVCLRTGKIFASSEGRKCFFTS